MGQAPVSVATDKVTVQDLHVSMVTGMTMKLHSSKSGMVGIWVAKVKGHDQIFAQNQVRICYIKLYFHKHDKNNTKTKLLTSKINIDIWRNRAGMHFVYISTLSFKFYFKFYFECNG